MTPITNFFLMYLFNIMLGCQSHDNSSISSFHSFLTSSLASLLAHLRHLLAHSMVAVQGDLRTAAAVITVWDCSFTHHLFMLWTREMKWHQCSQDTCFAGSRLVVYINPSRPPISPSPLHHTIFSPYLILLFLQHLSHPRQSDTNNQQQHTQHNYYHQPIMADMVHNFGRNILQKDKDKAPGTDLHEHDDDLSSIGRSSDQSRKTKWSCIKRIE